jgi:adenylate cyclase 10
LEQWIIYLEFARAKAIYDDFVLSYGKISFPIGAQMDYFDPQYRFDVHMQKKIHFAVK